MSKRSLRAIGAFVLFSLMLIVGAVFLFGSSDMFKQKRTFVAYFERSVTGLKVGSPVKFRGIEIGEVTSVEGVFDPARATLTPRIIVDVYPETMRNAELQGSDYNLFEPLVKAGMRASLKSQSMVTGQLYVSLDFHPDKPVRMLGTAADTHPEMPTIETGLGEFLTSLEEVPLDKLAIQFSGTLTALEQTLSNEDLKRSFAELPDLLRSLEKTAQAYEQFAKSDLPKTTAELRGLMSHTKRSVDDVTGKLNDGTLVKLEQALDQLNRTLAVAEQRLDRSDPVSREMVTTLQDLSEAADSVKRLTDYLEEHPEAIVRGRK